MSAIETNFEDYREALILEQKANEKEQERLLGFLKDSGPYILVFIILLFVLAL